MDNLTHALIGLTLNNTLPATKRNWGTFWVSLVASELPDMDILYRIKSGAAYLLNHRGISHSIPAMLVFAGITTLVSRKAFPNNRPKLVFFLALGCLGLHILFDLFTSWGTQLLTPLYDKWFYLDYLPIVDLVIIVIMLFFLLLRRTKRFNQKKLAFLALVLISGFVMARGVTHAYLVEYLQKAYPNAHVAILPGYSPLKWKGILEFENTLIKGDINLPGSGDLENTKMITVSQVPMEKYKDDDEFNRVTDFFRKPIYTIKGDKLVVNDFYYDFREVVFPLDKQGKIAGKASSGDRRSRISYNLIYYGTHQDI